MQSYSQHGQDRHVYETFFKDRASPGVFIDVGAYDGVTFSNTLFFEEHLGWNGICIEPLPGIFEELKANRRALCLNHAVSDFTGTGKFLDVDLHPFGKMYSGLRAYYHGKHREVIGRFAETSQLIEVEVKPLDTVLTEQGIERVDYLSIDAEGAELPILLGAGLIRHAVQVLSVENNYRNRKIRMLLEGLGYRRVHVFAGIDELYCKTELVDQTRPLASSRLRPAGLKA